MAIDPLKMVIFPGKMVDLSIVMLNYQRLWMAYGSSPADLETLTQQVGK